MDRRLLEPRARPLRRGSLTAVLSPKVLRDFNYKSNSIGFLRFLLASLVVWSHSPGLGGFGTDPIARFSGGFENGGTLAVAGFFFLSGFLITRSYGTSGSIVAFILIAMYLPVFNIAGTQQGPE